jgi:chemotaxis protein CheD
LSNPATRSIAAGAIENPTEINRYWDPVHRIHAAKILPGQLYISDTGEVIVTVLGSCVSACVRDVRLGIGGMNHFMLPDAGFGPIDTYGADERYGHYAMESLVNGVLRHGGRRDQLEVKLVGGGAVLACASDIGARNIAFARRFIAMDGLRLAAEDVGGVLARKVYYFPRTGLIRVRRLFELKNDTVQRRDAEYRDRLRTGAASGSVEIF